MMITYKLASSSKELQQILTLQEQNLPVNISDTEKQEQGFVTVHHDMAILQKMNDAFPHVIAIHDDKVVGYALSMLDSFKNDIPVLVPMFAEIDKALTSPCKYIVMGQVCVDKAYRGKGIFRGLYAKMKEETTTHFDAIITEIDALNTRSLNAHSAVGFEDLTTYTASSGQVWKVVTMPL